ncbi:MAG: hypothetical protein WA884_18765 [Methyloceanibacter sp.]
MLSITELGKPQGVWCQHCHIGVGCKIYDHRPRQCSAFYCGFLTQTNLSEDWRPSKCKIVLVAELEGARVAAYVDPGRPDAWKEKPYYSQLREWARNADPTRHQVVVCVGPKTIVILPDEDVDLGIVREDELIVTGERHTPAGIRQTALKMKRPAH